MGKNIALVIITIGLTLIAVEATARYGTMGLVPAALIAVLVVYLRYRVQEHLEEREKKRFYAARVWGFIEHTRFPGDDEELVRAQEHREWLELAGNDLDVPVDVVIWRENNPNETWEDFLVYLGNKTAKLKEKRDQALQKGVLKGRVSRIHGPLTREWYYRVALGKKIPERPVNGLSLEINEN